MPRCRLRATPRYGRRTLHSVSRTPPPRRRQRFASSRRGTALSVASRSCPTDGSTPRGRRAGMPECRGCGPRCTVGLAGRVPIHGVAYTKALALTPTGCTSA
jgi:hypothetical protein